MTRTLKCFWCVIRYCVNTLFGDSTEMKKLPSVAMTNDKGDLSEVDPKNIIMPSLGDLPDDVRQLYEKQKRFVSKRSCRCSSQAVRKIGKVS
jgi:hypothetical protein